MVKIDKEGNLRGTVSSLFSAIPLFKKIKTSALKSGEIIESGSPFIVKDRLGQLILAQIPKEKRYSDTDLEKEILDVLNSQGLVEGRDFFKQHFVSGLRVYHLFDFWIPAFKLGIEPGAIYWHIQRIGKDMKLDAAVREVGGYILWYTEYEIKNKVANSEIVEVLGLFRRGDIKSAAKIIDRRKERYFATLEKVKEQLLK